jgi:hypothetical protein
MFRPAIRRTMWVTAMALGLSLPAAASDAAPPRDASDCCQVSLAGLPGQFVAAAPPQQFSAVFHNGGQSSISGLQLNFSFGLAGARTSSSQMHLQRRTADGSWHTISLGRRGNTITGNDSVGGGIASGATATWQYQMWFGDKAPNAHFAVTVAASGRGSGFNRARLAISPTYQMAVTAVAAATTTPTTPKPTPTATPTTTPDTPTATPTQEVAQPSTIGTPPAAAPLDGGDTSGSGSSLMWLAYTIGALLLIGGLGVIGALVWRRGPREVETEWPERDDYVPPPDPYAAPPAAPLPSTSYQPVVPGQYAPPAAWPDGPLDRPTAPGRHSPVVDPTRPR